MTIPKSYEALAADLASEKILSKTLLGQKEAYMKLADKGGLDLSESKAREAALREELETEKTGAEGIYQQLEFCQKQRDALQQRLTVAEQRAGDLEGLLRDASAWIKRNSFHGTDAIELWERIDAALKPAAEVKS
ncbi:MAG: hypothetical protein J6A65_01670 [Pseudomonas sp.]|nr:hypothetical protein [Pseudomonas sp.]